VFRIGLAAGKGPVTLRGTFHEAIERVLHRQADFFLVCADGFLDGHALFVSFRREGDWGEDRFFQTFSLVGIESRDLSRPNVIPGVSQLVTNFIGYRFEGPTESLEC
jgi:hypothetical protein